MGNNRASQRRKPKASRAGSLDNKAKKKKLTVTIRRELELGLEAIQFNRSKLSERRPSRTELVEEALELLIQKYRPHLTGR